MNPITQTPAKVAINGYGTIGKCVAEAVKTHPDMQVCGVTKQNLESDTESQLPKVLTCIAV